MIEIPEQCPACGGKLERVKDQLFCRCDMCPAQLSKQVEKYAKALKIKGLGAKTIESLGLQSIEDIYSLDYEFSCSVIGEKLTDKLFMEIEKASTVEIAQFIAGLGIPLIGVTAGNKLATVVDNMEEITLEKCKEAGLGDKASSNLLTWLESNPMQLPIKIVNSKVKASTTKSKTVVVTGKIPGYTRATMQEYLESLGYKVTSSVSKNTDILIVPNKTSVSSKVTKAEELGVEILTIDELEK